MELKIRTVADSRYPHGIKYSLIMIEPSTSKKVLMDNHHPKGPHVHLDEEEFDYEYTSDDKLIFDFKEYVFYHFKEKI